MVNTTGIIDIVVNASYSLGPLLSTVTAFFSPPFLKPVMEDSRAPRPSPDGGGGGGAPPGGGGARPGGGGGGAPAAGGGRAAGIEHHGNMRVKI